MSHYHQPLIPGETYHLFSRAVGSEKLFRSNENYRYFLQKLWQHIGPVTELFTYSLLPNHFHLVARIKTQESIIPFFESVKNRSFNKMECNLPDFIMERFSNWLNGYTKAYNKMYHRKGALFLDYLKRSHAASAEDFSRFVFYVHKNAVHHGLTKSIGQWEWDAYKLLLNTEPTALLRNELLDWFGGREQFIEFHQKPVQLKAPDWMDLDTSL
jgi:putative transposase